MFAQFLQQIQKFWGGQSRAQRVVLITLVLSAAILIPVFLVWASTPTYAVAFSGLSEADAGAIVENLTASSIPYQLKGNGTILVQTSQVYEVRLSMATQGLPSGGSVGYELFSGNTIGMTEFTQRVNYQRALEGELERTIKSLNAIDAVRVHIVTPERTLLASDQSPTTASVTVKEKIGQQIDDVQVRAITHLVASSVEGMKPENVVVVDMSGNLLASGQPSEQTLSLNQTDDRRVAETLAARELKAKVQEILDKALGPNKSVVQTSVVLDWTQRETITQSFQPTETALRSVQTVTEVYTGTADNLAGIPGSATNLPQVFSTTSISGTNPVLYQRHENTSNFEITEVNSTAIETPGQIKRISLSVLVDGVTDQAQLTSMRSVISAAAGIDTTRGDILAVESLAFDRTYYDDQTAQLAADQQNELYMQIGLIAGGVLLLLLILWYVMRLFSNLRLVSAEAWTPILKPVSELTAPAGAATTAPALSVGNTNLTQELPSGDLLSSIQNGKVETMPEPQKPQFQLPVKPEFKLPKLEAAQAPTEEQEQIQQAIEQLADEDPAALADVIQMWLKES